MSDKHDLMQHLMGAAKKAQQTGGVPQVQLPRFIELIQAYQKIMHDIYVAEQLVEDPITANSKSMLVVGGQDSQILAPGGLPSKISMMNPREVLEKAGEAKRDVLSKLWKVSQEEESAYFIEDWESFKAAIPVDIRESV